MHSLSLHPHPDGPAPPIDALAVELTRPKRDRIALRFVATGEGVRHIRLRPTIGERRARHDGLWRHSCFELFVRPGDGDAYIEYNLAPSGDWACYRFGRYRDEMVVPRVPEPVIGHWLHLPRGADRERGVDTDIAGISRDFSAPFFELTAEIDLHFLAVEQPGATWHVGLSTVIESRNGTVSHWALAHPPGTPDFHHPDCFALELTPARPA